MYICIFIIYVCVFHLILEILYKIRAAFIAGFTEEDECCDPELPYFAQDSQLTSGRAGL